MYTDLERNTAMATERQIVANRINAQMSTGPKTEDGKLASRCNAVKHGLAGRGVVLPEAEEAKVERRIFEWLPTYSPLDPDERWAYEQMVRESVRIDRCDEEEPELRARLMERAGTCWDSDHALAAEELGQKLLARPALIARQLESTVQGLIWLIARWEGLAAVLENGKDWDDRLRMLAQSLLGVPVEFRENPSRLDLPASSTGDLKAHRLSLIGLEIARLRSLKDGPIAAEDAADRERVSRGIEVEPDRALARLRRYSAACHRRFKAASKTLTPVPKARRHDHCPPRSWSSPPRSAYPDSPRSGLPESPMFAIPTASDLLPSAHHLPGSPVRPLNRQQRRAMASLERAST
jgi:hypothetical protein